LLPLLLLVVLLLLLHRHPDIWPEADVWLPQRWVPAEAEAAGLAPHILSSSSRSQQPFLPFSSGPRGCIGRNYALLQMVLTVAVLLGSGLRFRPGGQARLQYVKGLTMHAKGGIWLTPYINAH
jgi:cytochrome P450